MEGLTAGAAPLLTAEITLRAMGGRFLSVAAQVAMLFILIAVGAAAARLGLLREGGVRDIAEVVLLFVTPCVIIDAFQRTWDPALLRQLGIAGLAALGIHAGTILLAHLLIRDPVKARRKVLIFGTVFSNAGYMGLPLQAAVLGEDGKFFGAAYIAVFNLIQWSYGLLLMSAGEKAPGNALSNAPRASALRRLPVRKLLLNPGLMGLAVGLPLFLWRVDLSARAPVVMDAVSQLSRLNTPLPMLIIGYHLSRTPLKTAFTDRRTYTAAGLRLLAVPVLAGGVLWLCGVRGTLLVSLVIAASAPAAAATAMFATRHEADAPLAVNLITVSTLLSVLTMPLIVGAAQIIS